MKIDPANLDARAVHELLTASIMPRPIALVSTISKDGILNLAPFSYCSPICNKPSLVGFSIGTKRDGTRKDTLLNIQATWEFVINIVNESMAEKMSQTAYVYPPDVDEFEEVGLTPVKADLVKPPLVGESPISLECRVAQIMEFGIVSRRNSFVIGEVLRFHIKDGLYADGKVQSPEVKTIGRMGGDFYCRTTDCFDMERPSEF